MKKWYFFAKKGQRVMKELWQKAALLGNKVWGKSQDYYATLRQMIIKGDTDETERHDFPSALKDVSAAVEANDQNTQNVMRKKPSESEETAAEQVIEPPSHSALQCLVAVARHHGLDLTVEGLLHQYAIGNVEPTTERLVRVAREQNMKARNAKIKWEDLWRMGEAYPFMARLKNGNTVVFAGVDGDPEDGRVAVFDPLAESFELILIPKEKILRAWGGEAIFLKRNFALNDEDQPFGIRWFIPEILRQRRAFRDVIIAALVMHGLALATPIFFQIVIDKVLPHNSQSTLIVLTIGIVCLLIFDAIFDFIKNYMLLNATSKIDVRLAMRTFNHLLKLPIHFFEHVSAGVLTKHMQQTSEIREFLTGKLFHCILDSSALFVFMPILMVYSLKLSGIVFLFSLLMAGVIAALIGPFRRRLQALYRAEGERQALLVETIHGVQTVKALAIEPTQRRDWDTKAARAVSMHFNVGKISISARALSGFLEKLMTVAIVFFGAMFVFDNTLTIGALVAFQMIAGRVSGPLVQIVSLVHEYQETALSVRMLGEVMNAPTERGIDSRGLMPKIQGEISLDGVNFSYAQNLPPALNNVSLKIPAGKVYGIVGRSGSGKTTLTRLIQGLYPPQGGGMRVDNYDIRELDLTHLRRNIGVVLQENFLFRGAVRDNISMTKPEATFEEIVDAARLAGADEFVQRLPQGYDTILEEGATNLSGGQRQRLAIARALLKQPRILILDEATSALDPESEAIIQENLKNISKGRTVLIVSHRLSMLCDADAIIVMERGVVADIAPHPVLLERCEVYKQLWDQQTKHVGKTKPSAQNPTNNQA